MDQWPVLYKAPLEGEVEKDIGDLSHLFFNGRLDILELCKRAQRLRPEPWNFVMEPGIQVATKKTSIKWEYHENDNPFADETIGWSGRRGFSAHSTVEVMSGEEFQAWQRRMYLVHGADYRVHSVEILRESVRLVHAHYGQWGIKKLIRAAVDLEIEQLAAKVHASIEHDMLERIRDHNAIDGEIVKQPLALTHDKD